MFFSKGVWSMDGRYPALAAKPKSTASSFKTSLEEVAVDRSTASSSRVWPHRRAPFAFD